MLHTMAKVHRGQLCNDSYFSFHEVSNQMATYSLSTGLECYLSQFESF